MVSAAFRSKMVVLLLLIQCVNIVALIFCCCFFFVVDFKGGGAVWSLFCSAVFSILSSFAIILLEKRELVILLNDICGYFPCAPFRVWKQVKLSWSCLSIIYGFQIFLCHIGVPTFS